MAKLLKLGISKPKKAKFPIKRISVMALIILCGLPSFACTRSLSNPPRLTESAIRFEITKIGLQTAQPTLEYIQSLLIRTASSAPTKPIDIVPLQQTETPEPAVPDKRPVAIEIMHTATESPVPTIEPTPRNTFPVEQINPDIPFTATPLPARADNYFPILNPNKPEILLPTEALPIVLPTATELPDLESAPLERLLYVTQNGDTIQNLSIRFGVNAGQISSIHPLSDTGFLDPNLTLFINAPQNKVYESAVKILPDEFIVFSETAANYDLRYEIEQAGGYLASYQEYTSEGLQNGKDIVYKVCKDYSINPIIMLALLEYKSQWVYGNPVTAAEKDYPLGWIEVGSKGLQKQLSWAADTLSRGYYGWRNGNLIEVPFYKYPKPPQPIYFDPSLNAGSVAIQYLFSRLFNWMEMDAALYGENGFFATFVSMFGNVWENYVPNPNGLNASLKQVEIMLPFSPSETWALTGGPHAAWGSGTPFAALDFAPPSTAHGCAKSDRWVLSATPGVVTRVGKGVVIVDVDGDGLEETGWVLLYLHIATEGKIAVGTPVSIGTRIGYPSCEGGNATGTHVHIARKYNGEWMNATGAIPFTLSGWSPYQGQREYLGGLTRGNQVVSASTVGSQESLVSY